MEDKKRNSRLNDNNINKIIKNTSNRGKAGEGSKEIWGLLSHLTLWGQWEAFVRMFCASGIGWIKLMVCRA